MRVACGTSGFSYPAWKGSFYPADLPARRMLSSYASRLDAVEANVTFRRLPRPEMLAAWHSQVPPRFVFALKAPQRITHVDRLVGAESTVAALYRAAAELGANLGAVLYQLPPTFRKDVPRLRDFLALLPAPSASAFEFRHPSWYADDVFAVLAAAGAALCVAETDDGATPLVATGRLGYLRLRRTRYESRDLHAWAERILGQAWEDALVFFKHEEEARAPTFALTLRDIVERSSDPRPDAGAPTTT